MGAEYCFQIDWHGNNDDTILNSVFLKLPLVLLLKEQQQERRIGLHHLISGQVRSGQIKS